MLLCVSCVPPPPRHDGTCRLRTDCDPDHVCENGVCVPGIDAGATTDAPPSDASSVDAAPEHATFTIGATDCSAGRCKGGYNGAKDTTGGPPTADKLCTDHAYARSDSFTFSTSQPGGKFCTWNATTMQYGCDNSCSGCNAIDTIACTRP
jgi:hypothetical protein